MKLEIKTDFEIWNNATIVRYYQPTGTGNSPTISNVFFKGNTNKKWVSVESLLAQIKPLANIREDWASEGIGELVIELEKTE
jgi:hypothetical protein